MSLVGALFQRMLVLLTGFVYCFGVLCKVLIDCVRDGPSKVLTCKKRNKPPACLEDPSVGTHGYVHLEHIRMHYVSNGPEDRPLMLLVHGFPEFWYSWRHQLREFKDNYRVVAVDLRGYNESDKPSGTCNYSQVKLINDLKQVITALGYSSCVLVGHDWGGILAWGLAVKYPEVVTKLIVLNAPNLHGGIRYLPKFSQFKKSWYAYFFQMPWIPEFAFATSDYKSLDWLLKGKDNGVQSDYMTDDDVEAYKYVFSRGGLTAPINFYRAFFSLDGLMAAEKMVKETERKGVAMPTLVVWGDRDGAIDSPMAELSCEVCKGEYSIKHIEGASHWVQMDRPDLVNKYMRDFLTTE